MNAELLPGRITAIVGSNGSGKSTLLLNLLGYLRPQAGKIFLSGTPLENISPRWRAAAISFVAQRPVVHFAFTVEQIVRMGTWPARQNGSGGTHWELVNHAMQVTDIAPLADRPFNELSAGEQQRVAIARALATQASAMLLDEPNSMLDLRHQLDLFSHLRDLAHKENKTIGWVTHDLNQARKFADHVIILHQGRVVAAGSPMETLTPATLEPVYGVKVRVQEQSLIFSRFNE
ncbi:MAG TPA: ABC transporter ATP-binding protein [Phycisphaerae bacterium]|nr:ABC transporter ATP-binding protein [Phycisphaerae bacterium]